MPKRFMWGGNLRKAQGNENYVQLARRWRNAREEKNKNIPREARVKMSIYCAVDLGKRIPGSEGLERKSMFGVPPSSGREDKK